MFVIRQCRNEHDILRNVRNALREALAWDIRTIGFTKKLSSVRFVLQSLHRHFERLMELEEAGGYMVVVDQLKPNLGPRAKELRLEHEEFRALLCKLQPSIESLPSIASLSDEEMGCFNRLCDELCGLLNRIDAHEEKEDDLLQEAFLYDEGGEG